MNVPEAREIFEEINKLRRAPKDYVAVLESTKDKIEDGDMLKYDGRTTIRMKEGITAVDDAIDELRKAEPFPELTFNEALSEAAKAHCDELGKPNALPKNEGAGGETVKDRLKRFGKIVHTYGQSMSFNCISAEEVVVQLLISDGNKERRHRKNLLNPEYKVVGIASGKHEEYNTMAVIDFAGGFVGLEEEDPATIAMKAYLDEKPNFDELMKTLPGEYRSWK